LGFIVDHLGVMSRLMNVQVALKGVTTEQVVAPLWHAQLQQ
jgi:hypothetical protein